MSLRNKLSSVDWIGGAIFSCLLMAVALLGFATVNAQSVTQARATGDNHPIRKITLSWTSDGAGAVSATIANINGEILRVVTNPDGTDIPTDNYDIVLNDADGFDVLVGLAANRDTATTEAIAPGIALTNGVTISVVPFAVNGNLTLSVTNAGAAKKGVITIYLRG